MYGRFLLVLVLSQLTTFAFSQKKVSKKIVNVAEQSIQIDGGNCFRVDLETTEGNELVVEAFIEGEYSRDLAVKLKEEGSNLIVSTDFLPNFKDPNDKLSAHKVVSIALSVRLPKYSQVKFYGTYANVTAKGLYRTLDIVVADGNCFLQSRAENTTVRTQSGEIWLTGINGEIAAHSKYGKVYRQKVPEGDYNYELYSIEGDIWINIPMK